jgi:hypothetical protein
MRGKLADGASNPSNIGGTRVSEVRDVLVVLLGSALMRMDGENLTVGQTADLLLAMLKREGYEITRDRGQQ